MQRSTRFPSGTSRLPNLGKDADNNFLNLLLKCRYFSVNYVMAVTVMITITLTYKEGNEADDSDDDGDDNGGYQDDYNDTHSAYPIKSG